MNWFLLHRIHGGVEQIPGQFDSCDNLNTWTRTNGEAATNCADIYSTLSSTYCANPPCIILQGSNDNCASPKWISRSFNAIGYWSLSMQYDIYINNFNGLEDGGQVSIICNNKETILKEYSPSYTTRLYRDQTAEITLNIFGCDDSIFTVKFLVKGDTNDVFIAIDNVRINAYVLETTPTPTVSCPYIIDECNIVGTSNSNRYRCKGPNAFIYESWDNSKICNSLTATSSSIESDTPYAISCCPPTNNPTINPTQNPTKIPTKHPTYIPTMVPTIKPTLNPTSITLNPSKIPTKTPTKDPTELTLNPTQIPTQEPTMEPTQNPTKITSNPTSFTLNPSYTPTKGPTFGKQECNDIYIIDQEYNHYSSNFSLLGISFKIIDVIGINNHLYWDSNQQYGYRLYYDSSWIIYDIYDNIKYIYIQNKNSTKTLLDIAGYPPLNRLTSWYLLINNNINKVDINNYIQLYLSCNMDTDDVDDRESITSLKEGKIVEYTTFVIGGLLLIAIILLFVIFLVHATKRGSDKPGYISVIRCFIEIADFYTDISFAYLIYLSDNGFIWWLIPILCISFAYILSILIALYKINKYKKSGEPVISNYMKNFDKLWLTLTLIFGFYATFDLLSSHIFHLTMTSFQATKREQNNIKTLRIINFVLIENLGMIILQIIYLSYIGYFNNIYIDNISSDVQITLLSISFGIISIISGLLTVTSRFIECCTSSSKKQKQKIETEFFCLDIISKDINKKHIYSHLLISMAIGKSIKFHQSSLETLSIVPTTKGIHSKIAINISNHYELENYRKLFQKHNDIKHSLRNELQNVLKLPSIKDIYIEKIKTTKSSKYGEKEASIEYQLSDHDTDGESDQDFKEIEMGQVDRVTSTAL